MLEELSVPFFIALLLFPLGIALFGLGWALRSYRCRYELDNAVAAARRGDTANGVTGEAGKSSASTTGKKTPAGTGSSSSAAAEKTTTKKSATTTAAKSASAAASSAKDEYTAAQQTVLDRTAKEAVQFTSGKSEADDLTKIKGVAKVLNGRLNSLGIYSYEQIARWKKADIDVFGDLLAFKERMVNDDWSGQAKALYKEKYGKALK